MTKTEWQYLAAVLIFGHHKIRSKELSIYDLDVFKAHKELEVKQVSSVDIDTGRLDTRRHLRIRPHINLTATHIQAGSEIAKILIYESTEQNVHISDAIFTETEFELTKFNWDKLIVSRVYKLSLLIKSIHNRVMEDVPLLINEFPNISGLLLKDEKYWS